MQIQKQFQKAFSLIEISIVLIIIGLLVYGATSGKALINRARIIKMRDYTKSFSSLSVNKNLAFWIESSMPDAYETASDGTIAIIDKAIFDGARTDVTSRYSSESPTYTENAINKLPAFYFDGNDDCINNNDMAQISSKPHTIFFIAKQTNTDNNDDLIYSFSNPTTPTFTEAINFKNNNSIRLQNGHIGHQYF